MTDKALGGPLAVDITSTGNGWICTDCKKNTAHQRASGPGANGDEAAFHMHDGITTVTVNLVNYTPAGTNLVLPVLGSLQGGFLLTEFTLTGSPTGWPTLTKTLHQHDVNPHGALASYTCPVTVPAGVGIPLILEDADDFATCTRTGYTLTMKCDHAESLGATGDHDAGNSQNGMCTLALQFKGAADLAAAIAGDGWQTSGAGDGTSQKDFDVTDYSLTKAVSRDV